MEYCIVKQKVLDRFKLAHKLRSDTELAKFLGLSKSTISNWSNRNSIDYDLLFSFCGQINLDWLLTGSGDMLRYDNPADLECPEFKRYSTEPVKVPLYDAATATDIVNLLQPVYKQVPQEYIAIPGAPRCNGAVYIKGDSMYPLLKSGDIVLYKAIHDVRNGICWGDMYIVAFDMGGEDHVVVKYIQPGHDKDTITLVSQNSYHAPQEIHISRIRALALVKVNIRFNTMG